MSFYYLTQIDNPNTLDPLDSGLDETKGAELPRDCRKKDKHPKEYV